MLLRNDIVSLWFWGYRGDWRIELQAPVSTPPYLTNAWKLALAFRQYKVDVLEFLALVVCPKGQDKQHIPRSDLGVGVWSRRQDEITKFHQNSVRKFPMSYLFLTNN